MPFFLISFFPKLPTTSRAVLQAPLLIASLSSTPCSWGCDQKPWPFQMNPHWVPPSTLNLDKMSHPEKQSQPSWATVKGSDNRIQKCGKASSHGLNFHHGNGNWDDKLPIFFPLRWTAPRYIFSLSTIWRSPPCWENVPGEGYAASLHGWLWSGGWCGSTLSLTAHLSSSRFPLFSFPVPLWSCAFSMKYQLFSPGLRFCFSRWPGLKQRWTNQETH